MFVLAHTWATAVGLIHTVALDMAATGWPLRRLRIKVPARLEGLRGAAVEPAGHVPNGVTLTLVSVAETGHTILHDAIWRETRTQRLYMVPVVQRLGTTGLRVSNKILKHIVEHNM